MTGSTQLKKTVLHGCHTLKSANMAGFGGYHMPLWYETGARAEHLAVIESAGLFDTSHMAVITVGGSGAYDLLQHAFTRDLDRCIGTGPLVDGRSVYGLFLETDGTVLDDAIIGQLGMDNYMVVVNAGMGPLICDHLRELATADVNITDHSDTFAKIDLQGPSSALILQKLLDDPDGVLDDLRYFSFKGDLFGTGRAPVTIDSSIPLLLSRTGYTGEFGFELFVDGAHGETLWNRLLEAGAPYGLTACGLASRDSLRTGAMLPLSHQDIGNWKFGHTPWSFVLPTNGKGATFTKQFVGADSLLKDDADFTCGFAGYDPRKIPISDTSVVLDESGDAIGTILTCTTDMAVDRVGEDRSRIVSIATAEADGRPEGFRARGLSCGFIRANRRCRAGEQLWLVEGKRKICVEVRDDIRPDRTARFSMKRMRSTSEERGARQ